MTRLIETKELKEDSELPRSVSFVRGVYWFLVVCGLLVLLGDLVGQESAKKISVTEATFMTIINILILYGLQKRKNWVVSLILYFSAWNLFSNFLRVIGETASTGDMMKQKIASLILALFCIYQIQVFRQKETKLYFSQKGLTLY
jgi:hypothetical protein